MIPVAVWREIIDEGFSFAREEIKSSVPREIEGKIENEIDMKEIATVLIGVRRAGKTTLALRIARKKDFVYINFEDERLAALTLSDLTQLAKLIEGREVVILDEIQNVKGWEKWVRRLIAKKKQKFIITGSNSSLLAGEFSSSLTGRKKSHVVFPFSYREAKQIRDLSLEDYLSNGGFPDVLKLQKAELALEYAEDILYRDIVMRYNVREKEALKKMFWFLLNHPGIIVSKKKLSSVISLSHKTIAKFLSYMENAFVVFSCKRESPSYYERMKSLAKVYPIDNGFVAEKRNRGKLLESAVAQELARMGEVRYIREKNEEVDFSFLGKRIQVVYELNEENVRREVRPIREGGILIVMYGYESVNLPEGVTLITAREFFEKGLENLEL